jgi:N-methylhydantoinase B/oxoprolinase/acetone carboxylase alpha subunit
LDVIEFEILYKNLISIAEEMGVVLQKSSYSPNIRERLDASCAIFGDNKNMLAQAEHIPVHLGSMHMPLNYIEQDFFPGDQIILNDPSMGGTHLPDITIYKPLFFESKLIGFTSNRAHHADIGGIAPGSIPGNSTELFQEGLIIPPIKIVNNNETDRDILSLILANTRTPYERQGDLMAQIGANNHGASKIGEFISNYGIDKFQELEHEILKRTDIMFKKRLETLPKGEYSGKDVLEFNNDFLEINVNILIGEKIKIDFTGTSVEPKANINAPLAVTHSAVFFFFRTILGNDIPINSAFYDFFKIVAREGSIVNAPKNAPVVGGNVETSQRIVDTLMNAFSTAIDLPAQSQGTMNNISFGNSDYTFYETIGGGAGAGNGYAGSHGVHVYMTNTKNTPVEVIEAAYPLLCTNYSLRHGSGGSGKWSGGEGIIKGYLVLEPCTFSIISDRRKIAPKGISGGMDGLTGENYVVKGNKKEPIGGKTTLKLDVDDEIMILTPGGGGYGKPKSN